MKWCLLLILTSTYACGGAEAPIASAAQSIGELMVVRTDDKITIHLESNEQINDIFAVWGEVRTRDIDVEIIVGPGVGPFTPNLSAIGTTPKAKLTLRGKDTPALVTLPFAIQAHSVYFENVQFGPGRNNGQIAARESITFKKCAVLNNRNKKSRMPKSILHVGGLEKSSPVISFEDTWFVGNLGSAALIDTLPRAGGRITKMRFERVVFANNTVQEVINAGYVKDILFKDTLHLPAVSSHHPVLVGHDVMQWTLENSHWYIAKPEHVAFIGKSGADTPAPITLNRSKIHVFNAGELPKHWTLNETSISTYTPETYAKTLERTLNTIDEQTKKLTRVDIESLDIALK